MRCLPIMMLIALSLNGCGDANRSTTNATLQEKRTGAEVDRDNTGLNERDRTATAKTPIDQNENKADIDITTNIRKRVVDTKMSVNAQNIKIITQDGKVTLRGPVKSAEEKQQIEKMAQTVAGAGKVESQLEIEK